MDQRELWEEFYQKNPMAWRGITDIDVPCSGSALDLGCGNGKTVAALLDAGMETTGVDFSETAIEKCRRQYPGATFVVCDVSSLPFPDGCFDLVTAIHVLENLDDEKLETTVQEIRRVLKDDGRLLVRCFTPRDMRAGTSRNGLYYRYFTADELVRRFEGLDALRSTENDEPTRFGTIRSRAECLFRKPPQETDARN